MVADPAEIIPAFSAAGKTVEVVFSFDATGSMYGVLAQVNLLDISSVAKLLIFIIIWLALRFNLAYFPETQHIQTQWYSDSLSPTLRACA